MKAGIAIDKWKLEIFERKLKEAGYTWTTGPGMTADTMFLYVETDNPQALGQVVFWANNEAAALGQPNG